IWFHTGDRDLAVHLVRSQLLAHGLTLSQATAEIASKLGVAARILPLSNSRVETRVMTPTAGELSFEEYFVQRWFQDPVESVRFAGAADAEPAPGVVEAIKQANLVLIAPSNPVTSIGPILAIPGVREALLEAKAAALILLPNSYDPGSSKKSAKREAAFVFRAGPTFASGAGAGDAS